MNPNTPAFPIIIVPAGVGTVSVDLGMDLRTYIATACLQGIHVMPGPPEGPRNMPMPSLWN
jgi:hypothetical protein